VFKALNPLLQQIAAMVLLAVVMNQTGLSIGSWQYWGIIALIWVLNNVAQHQGKIMAIHHVMEMPQHEYLRYKAAWIKATEKEQDND